MATTITKTTATAPPPPPPHCRESDLVELIHLDSTFKLDVRYATTNNFTGHQIYDEPRCFLQRPAAEALVRVHQALKGEGYGLVLFDGYRPWSATKLFYDITPDHQKIFVADPAVGSRHNRGCAIDLSLFDLETGENVEMPSAFDEMTERAFVTYQGGTEKQRVARDLLRTYMQANGQFFVYPEEWWHWDFKDYHAYAVQNISFSEIKSCI
ncbi:Aste57867_412 [Aphanomyces stellatus]|uniref:Aste57867_412 protein n=1 Tax=Aphanomyces stellatus TaxID=120398 RepID=A0A485K3Q8_9STRA|nr:hypothetical protein As57867_000411 [Aphanomyces stellatus]VFT77637.1 Aste57867_412 [Aphanomyces stellatus]